MICTEKLKIGNEYPLAHRGSAISEKHKTNRKNNTSTSLGICPWFFNVFCEVKYL